MDRAARYGQVLEGGARKEQAELASGEARSAAAAKIVVLRRSDKDEPELMGTSSIPASFPKLN